jgi:hypothetical protein
MSIEYLTVTELSLRIKYTEQSIYNLIHNGRFVEGLHFFKPTPKKILFKWQVVVNWIEGQQSALLGDRSSSNPGDNVFANPSIKTLPNSINI